MTSETEKDRVMVLLAEALKIEDLSRNANTTDDLFAKAEKMGWIEDRTIMHFVEDCRKKALAEYEKIKGGGDEHDITIEEVYKEAQNLVGKNYCSVSFVYKGQKFTVKPARLARKIHDLEKALHEANGMSKWLPVDKNIDWSGRFLLTNGKDIEIWDGAGFIGDATHWIPLPEPPESE
jgi:hypothetical protein